MDEQTRKLYEECNTGCQMAIESMQQIKDFTQDTTLFQLIENSGNDGFRIFLVQHRT